MQKFLWLYLAATAVVTSCTEPKVARLRSDSGAFELTYACTDSVPRALDEDVVDLVRNLVVRESSEHVLAAAPQADQQSAAAAVRDARERGDVRALERAVAGYVCAHGSPPTRPPRFPEPGSVPPDFALSLLEPTGGPHAVVPARLSDLKGRAVALVFWSTWCPACGEEYAELQTLSARGASENISTYAILHGDTPGNLRDWQERYGGGVVFLKDQGGRIARQYGVYGIPYTVVLRPDGRVHTAGHVGPQDLQRVVDEALKSSR